MNLITLKDPRSPISEAYRTLRTNLSFYSLDDPIRSLVVTSAAGDEGKGDTVANLAVTMAQGDRKLCSWIVICAGHPCMKCLICKMSLD